MEENFKVERFATIDRASQPHRFHFLFGALSSKTVPVELKQNSRTKKREKEDYKKELNWLLVQGEYEESVV
ncbi:hypothetical protein V6N11_046366 [Hibiscus sabdariffa]|uniref:Uncharacterized protein n=1 Tax=Hibiscus sabdariffa TaxID=183260 RepID=A0ABR2P250_9ROSI